MLIREKGGNSKAKILTRNNDCDYIKGGIHQENIVILHYIYQYLINLASKYVTGKN